MKTLRGRLAVALGITALAAVVVTALVSVGLLRGFAERSAREDLRRLARAVAADPFGPETIGLNRLRRVLQVSGDELALVRADGTIVGTSPGVEAVAAAVDVAAVARGEEVEGSVRAGGEVYVYIAAPVAPAGFGPPVSSAAVIARPLRLTRDLWVGMVGRIALGAAGVMLLAMAASSWFAGRLARPVGQLSDAARRIARGDLEHRVPVEGEDELAALAASFNAMSEALGEARRREREFLASVSHELRTPITAIRGFAEAMQEGAVDDAQGRERALTIIVGEADRLERMIRDVMDLARLGAERFTLEVSDVDLRATLADAVQTHRAQAEGAGVALRDATTGDVPVRTDPDRVRQIVSNLVENALRVTDEGGSITVTAAPADGGGARIEIADTGPGIAPEDLPHVFERSYLWRASKGERPVGTGLGLAIVRELVAALGGSVAVTSLVGAGSTFTITLPARAPDAQPRVPDA